MSANIEDPLAPIALFCYSRLNHLKRTVESLKLNNLSEESELYIFSDGPKDDKNILQVKKVREYINELDGFKSIEIIESITNKGLSRSIIEGVSYVLSNHEKLIVLEDDLESSKYFLTFMNDALNAYKNNTKVSCVHGYSYPIKNLPNTFFLKGADCWGWGTWKDDWQLFEEDGKKLLNQIKAKNLAHEFNFYSLTRNIKMLSDQIIGKNDSWAIRWHASLFLKNKLCLFPGKTFIKNIGFDDSGIHGKTHKIYDNDLCEKRIYITTEDHDVEVLKKVLRSFKIFYIKVAIIRIKNKFISLFIFR